MRSDRQCEHSRVENDAAGIRFRQGLDSSSFFMTHILNTTMESLNLKRDTYFNIYWENVKKNKDNTEFLCKRLSLKNEKMLLLMKDSIIITICK